MKSATQKILITGATGSIGEAIAKRLAAPGRALVLGTHRNADAAHALAQELSTNACTASVIAMDITPPEAPRRIVGEAANRMDGLDALIHCAATFERTPLMDLDEAAWHRTIDANLTATFFLAQAAARTMEGRGGRMIFFSDVAAQKPYGDWLPYSIAKAGVEALVKGLAKKLTPKIIVNAIAPYLASQPEGMDDDTFAQLIAKTPMQRAQSPEEIATLAAWLIDEAHSITGQVIAVDGGRTLP